MSCYSIYSRRFNSSDNSGEFLLRAAKDYTGFSIEMLRTERHPFGKPFFPRCPDVHFSITHSGDWWLCAFGEQPVGLDLQLHQKCDAVNIAHRFFHSDECEFLEASHYRDFFDVWASKESYLKYTGQGLSADLNSFSVISDGALACETGDAMLERTLFRPGYSMCLCAKGRSTMRFVWAW